MAQYVNRTVQFWAGDHLHRTVMFTKRINDHVKVPLRVDVTVSGCREYGKGTRWTFRGGVRTAQVRCNSCRRESDESVLMHTPK